MSANECFNKSQSEVKMENISAVIQEIIRVDRLVAQENQDAEDAAEKLLSDKTEELKK
jgi:hypothetical protein